MNVKLNERQELPDEIEDSIRNTIYSVGPDQMLNLKERIGEVHGVHSKAMKAANELDRYVSDPQTRKGPWHWYFYKKVKSAMSILYPHSDNAVRAKMTGVFIDDLFDGGYIRALQSLAVESGAKYTSFARHYAKRYGIPIGAALLFNPKGGASMELLHFVAAEKSHGMHRHGTLPDPCLSEETKNRWHDAQRCIIWPTTIDEQGQQIPLDIAEEHKHLPQGTIDKLRELWRRNPALRDYTGTNRLSKDGPYQIIEDVVDMLIQKECSILDETDKVRYSQIVVQANSQGIDPFYAAYRSLFINKDRWRLYWDKARKWLHNYSLLLWETQNQLWLAEGKRTAAEGVSFYKAHQIHMPLKRNRNGVPGTIYLNNGRYYWVVANKMKPMPLIDPTSKPKAPGTIFKDGNRYYWFIPRLLKRQRLVPKGQRFSAEDRTTAEKIAIRIWKQLKIQDPILASTIIKRTRSQGLATKDKATAIKVAHRLWRQIQRQDPELVARILKDNRPKAKDHWHAQIVTERKHRSLGSFQTQAEAQAAYAKEFENTWGYPPGYNVQSIPKLDKVWPTWDEEKARLENMNEHPRMPVIGQSLKTEPLEPLIKRMQRVDWLVENCILVLDEDSPIASQREAIQSRGEKWYAEIKKQGKHPVIQGSVSIDKDTGRIRITIYGQGLSESRVLAEEIYHIVFEIIRHASPRTFESIERWYSNRLRKGLDPTWHMHEAFVDLMVQEEEFPGSTDLPHSVVKRAQSVFSANNKVPDSAIQKIKTGA